MKIDLLEVIENYKADKGGGGCNLCGNKENCINNGLYCSNIIVACGNSSRDWQPLKSLTNNNKRRLS